MNMALEDGHTTFAEKDLRVYGTFLSRIENKDGSYGFGFSGVYVEIILNK